MCIQGGLIGDKDTLKRKSKGTDNESRALCYVWSYDIKPNLDLGQGVVVWNVDTAIRFCNGTIVQGTNPEDWHHVILHSEIIEKSSRFRGMFCTAGRRRGCSEAIYSVQDTIIWVHLSLERDMVSIVVWDLVAEWKKRIKMRSWDDTVFTAST